MSAKGLAVKHVLPLVQVKVYWFRRRCRATATAVVIINVINKIVIIVLVTMMIMILAAHISKAVLSHNSKRQE